MFDDQKNIVEFLTGSASIAKYRRNRKVLLDYKILEGVTVKENGNYIEVLIKNADKIKVRINLKAL